MNKMCSIILWRWFTGMCSYQWNPGLRSDTVKSNNNENVMTQQFCALCVLQRVPDFDQWPTV